MSDTGTRIRRGDTVRVTVGKDKGKEGKVIRSFAPDANPKKKKPSRLFGRGHQYHYQAQASAAAGPISALQLSVSSRGRIEMEAPIYTSKVAIVCPSCGKPTRIGVLTNESGERFRACKECGKSLD